MTKTYDSERYNCAHFAADAWHLITGKSIKKHLSLLMTVESERVVDSSQRFAFVPLKKPQSPCLVLLRNRIGTPEPHVGIFLGRKILHICGRGVEYLPLECVANGYQSVRYYTCR